MTEQGVDWDAVPEDLRKKVFIQVGKALDDSRDNPRSLIVIAHGFIELLVNTLIEKKTKNWKRMSENSRDFPHSTKLIILNELDLISDYRFRALDYFRKLRNKASHQPLFKIDFATLEKEYNHFAAGNDPDIPSLRFSNLHEFCLMMVVLLWNDHREIFTPVFF